jgi:uncharacterized membrane protein YtjA (UPF0391 family)
VQQFPRTFVVRRGTARWRARFADTSFTGVRIMLGWALTFLILAIVAGLLGFIALAGIAASIAKILFFLFLALLVVSFVMRALRGQSVT